MVEFNGRLGVARDGGARDHLGWVFEDETTGVHISYCDSGLLFYFTAAPEK
jgi:hypothetical protein